MTELFIKNIKEIDGPNHTVDLLVDFTWSAPTFIKRERKIIPIEKIEQFYYDEGLGQREMLGPSHLDASYDRVWTVDFWDEVEDGYLEKFVKDYLIENLK